MCHFISWFLGSDGVFFDPGLGRWLLTILGDPRGTFFETPSLGCSYRRPERAENRYQKVRLVVPDLFLDLWQLKIDFSVRKIENWIFNFPRDAWHIDGCQKVLLFGSPRL